MRVFTSFDQAATDQETVLTIGSFDGLHLGHQAVLRQVIERARATARQSGLVTFQRHPRAILSPSIAPKFLTTLEEKAALLAQLGLDILLVLPFTPALAATSAEAFVGQLVDRLRLCELWVGPNFALGKDRQGDAQTLQRLGEHLGYTLRVLAPVKQGEQAISSTQIRALLGEGRVREAANELGRYYSLNGVIVRGIGRARTLGAPTANLQTPEDKLVPTNGVYAAFAEVNGAHYPAVINIGICPTFQGEGEACQRTIEAHLLDAQPTLYDAAMTLHLVERLRAEQRFSSAAELAAQIQRDVLQAKDVLKAATFAPSPPSISVAEPPFEEIEHTADLALRVRGANLQELFINAARGLFYLMSGEDAYGQGPPDSSESIALESLDQENLLVDWLNELLYLSEAHKKIYTCFAFAVLTPTRLRAQLCGAERKAIKKVIKAATFYGLDIRQTSSGYAVDIILDV
jgi:riboflavin kinase/FMN adenylyltransferase